MKKKKYGKPAISVKKLSKFFFNCKAGGQCTTRVNQAIGTCKF